MPSSEAGSVTNVEEAVSLVGELDSPTLSEFQRLNYRLEQITILLERTQIQLAKVERSASEIRSLVGPVGIPMPEGQMLVQTLFGIKYLIDPSDLIMAPNLIVYRQWEADLSSFFWQEVSQDTVFVDAGANFGYFTCLAGVRIGRGGRGQVFSIEPNPNCLKLLDRNTLINWSMSPISIFRCAVGAKNGRALLTIPRNRAANASLTAPISENLEADRIDIEIRTIDEIVPQHVIVDFLKVDVEGHEHAALRGAADVIKRSPNIRIVMEWSPTQMKDAGYSITDMIDLLAELNLKAFRMADAAKVKQGSCSPLAPSELQHLTYDNLILMR